VAGEATIQTLANEPVYNKIDRLGQHARTQLAGIFDQLDYKAEVTGMGSLFAVHFTEKKNTRDMRYYSDVHREKSKRMFTFLLNNGILIMAPDNLHAAISYSHSKDDIDLLVSRVEEHVRLQAHA
jgi:glutamate-1-semialdehyde 2,1-aminomutase